MPKAPLASRARMAFRVQGPEDGSSLGPRAATAVRRLRGTPLAAKTDALVRRSWRFWPLGLFVLGGGYFAIQSLATPGSAVAIGQRVTMAQLQRSPVYVTINHLSIRRPPKADPVVREVTFTVAMQMVNPADSMMSGDALASYCSVLGTNGTVYPSDLARSSVDAALGIFVLSGPTVREGRVVSFIPTYVKVAGVSCQLGDTVVNWDVR